MLAAAGALLTMLPGLTQPRLEVLRPSETTLQFRWPGTAVGFVLEAANALATTTDWQPLDQAPVLADGWYSVTLPAEAATRFFRLRSTVVPLTTIASSSPANGEGGVAVTRATSIRFSGLVYDENPLSEGKIYAEHNGVRLPAVAELSYDEVLPVSIATLTYLADLPAGALIRVTVNGSLLRDDRDRLVDADGNGIPGGIRELEFETADGRPPDGDGDGIDDLAEATLGTDPAQWDTDEDGFSDGQEREAAADPLALDSRPGIRLADGPGTVGELMATFPAYGPFAVGPDAMAGDGQLPTGIEAMLNPQSTPAIVNQALEAAGLRIITLRPGLLFVTLALPPRPEAAYTPAEVAAIAKQLIDDNEGSDVKPFLLADPAFAPVPKLFPGAPGSEAAVGLRPQDQIRLPASWNLLALPPPTPARPVRVLVPDYYHATARHPQIRVQRFVASRGGATRTADGNHGFAVASAVAANFDDALPTGAYPTASQRPSDHLEVLSLPVGGLRGTADLAHAIMDAVASSQPDIVSTSLGFPAAYTRTQRIKLAYLWRQLVLSSGRQFLHVSAAGNEFTNNVPAYDRLAEFDSAWNLAARRGDLDDMLQGATELTPAEIVRLQNATWALPGNLPGLFEPLNNVVIVGSINPDGSRSAFSEPGEDVVAQGAGLTLACAQAFPGSGCDGTNWFGAAGTSFAAPQVAGVAAYLLTQKPGLSPTQLADALIHTRAGDVLDAYRAVLELDAGGYEQPLRRRLLDVAGGEEADASGARPNGQFDEQDLEAFVNAFRDAEALREPDDPPDRSRFDLNGDGFTGGSSTATFDLDYTLGEIGSSVLSTLSRQIRNVPVEFDETALTDLQILCYYAYSMYTGSPRERERILGAGCCPLPPMLAYRFSNDTGSGIQIISATTGAVGYQAFETRRSDGSSGGYGAPAWKPDGSELAFRGPNSTNYDSDILLVRVGSEQAEVNPFARLTSGPDRDYGPVYFAHEEPNGDTFFFTRQGMSVPNLIPLGVYVGQDPGMGPPRLINRYEGFYGYGMDWRLAGFVSPDNELVYTAEVSRGQYSLRAMKSSGVTRTLTPEDVNVGNVPAAYWSPDGASVAWNAAFRVQLLNVASREVRTLATNTHGADLSWAPDGRSLVFAASEFDQSQGQLFLATVDLLGGPAVPLTSFGSYATWSPDGKEIAFVRDNDVWVRTLATGAERRLTFGDQTIKQFLVWRPGSKTEP
jgi:Tol biopolymer transport system component